MAPPKRSSTPQDERYEEADILRADDPRPQQVPQFPAGARRNPATARKPEEHIPTTVYDTEKSADQELKPVYDPTAISDGGFKPAFLYVERGPGQGQLVQVLQGPLVVGRATVSDLRLQHPSVSRRHSQITRVGESFYIKDLGSQNGTFVNKQRIATEVEIFPGDHLAIGNALVKLRGPLQPGQALEIAPPAKKPTAAKSKRAVTTSVVRKVRPPNAVRLAFFAGAVGFGLAAMFALALWKVPTRVAFNPLPAAPVTSKGENKDKQIEAAIAQKMVEQKTSEEAVQLDVDPVPFGDAREKKEKASATKAAAPKHTDPFADAPGSAKADKAEKKTKEGTAETPKRGVTPAAYLQGDAQAALAEAEKSGDAAMAQKLEKFAAAYEAARAAVTANNGNQAIKSFEAALKLDASLSNGKSKYASDIHQQLSSLYSLVGFHYVSNNAPDNAKAAFKASLKHDPSNEKAKEQLAKLEQSDEGEANKAKGPPPPLRRPGVKTEPTSKKQAIDDAFGE
ncbi:MAG: FHA domain-containing protein [Myxococcaceae bacterium]|nr:FHA domain-containing protein [Myxococcaceae bacterium]